MFQLLSGASTNLTSVSSFNGSAFKVTTGVFELICISPSSIIFSDVSIDPIAAFGCFTVVPDPTANYVVNLSNTASLREGFSSLAVVFRSNDLIPINTSTRIPINRIGSDFQVHPIPDGSTSVLLDCHSHGYKYVYVGIVSFNDSDSTSKAHSAYHVDVYLEQPTFFQPMV